MEIEENKDFFTIDFYIYYIEYKSFSYFNTFIFNTLYEVIDKIDELYKNNLDMIITLNVKYCHELKNYHIFHIGHEIENVFCNGCKLYQSKYDHFNSYIDSYIISSNSYDKIIEFNEITKNRYNIAKLINCI